MPGNGYVEAIVRNVIQNNNEASGVPLDDDTISEIQSTTSNRTRALHALSYLDNDIRRPAVVVDHPITDEPNKRVNNEAFRHNAALLSPGRPKPPAFTLSDSGLSEVSQLVFCSIESVSDRGNALHMTWEQLQSKDYNYHTPSGHPTSNHSSQESPGEDMNGLDEDGLEYPTLSTPVNGVAMQSASDSEHVNGATVQSAGDLENVDSIKNRICSSLELSAFDSKDYLPLDQLCEILSPSVVRQILLQHFDESKASEYECEILGTKCQGGVPLSPPKRRRIFAILVSIKQVKRLPRFIEEGVDDRALPLHFTRIEKKPVIRRVSYMPHPTDETCDEPDCPCHNPHRTDELILKEFDVWPSETAQDFALWQPIIHVPFLKFPGDKIYFYDIHQDSTLPFEKYDLQETGGYGSVRKVTIHPSHFNRCVNSKDEQPICFAVKKPHVPNVSDYLQEIDPFDKLGIENKDSLSNHLIPLQLTFRHGRDYYLMFPWADGNLKQFWGQRKAKPEEPEEVRWFMAQCSGIARGLRKIHHLSTELSQKTVNLVNAKQMILGDKEWGRHGDIKPENILWFGNCEDKRDHLVISDFGLTRFNSAHSRSKVQQDQIQGFSGTYRPPDLHLEDQPISQNYDVWSLGCVFLEFVSWFLLGYEQVVDVFTRERMNEGQKGDFREDTFFTFENGPLITPRKAKLKDSVVKWIENLHKAPNCSEPLHALLDLIQFTMLLPNAKERWKCCWIDLELRKLDLNCNNSILYTQETPGGPNPNRYAEPPNKHRKAKESPEPHSQEPADNPSQDEAKQSPPQTPSSSPTKRKTTVRMSPSTGVRSSIQEESEKEIQPDHMDDTLDVLSGSQTSRMSLSISDKTARRLRGTETPPIGLDPVQESIEHQLDGYGSQFDGILDVPSRYGTPQEAFSDLTDDDALNEPITDNTKTHAESPNKGPKEGPKEKPKEDSKEECKDEPKEELKEDPKEILDEGPKEELTEEPKEDLKQGLKEEVKEEPNKELPGPKPNNDRPSSQTARAEVVSEPLGPVGPPDVGQHLATDAAPTITRRPSMWRRARKRLRSWRGAAREQLDKAFG
ncbi:hypothetical protein BHE90_006441 [Fusarium euwallaceae]|uniref:Protein kinase domain-containing protein n=2 Tax=Fusarium solani species complex TaxID=232080 RepID=A0A3M2SF39_9HYPO|nr:hypothetical protein CDV36_004096 [Fusarium kuroshium]RTE79100.1 hypothetical protein BHE90_006441 [Fusarium euwallaceae]